MVVELILVPTADLGAIAPVYETVTGDLRPIGFGITPLKMAYYDDVTPLCDTSSWLCVVLDLN
jgi:hypothetical protein